MRSSDVYSACGMCVFWSRAGLRSSKKGSVEEEVGLIMKS